MVLLVVVQLCTAVVMPIAHKFVFAFAHRCAMLIWQVQHEEQPKDFAIVPLISLQHRLMHACWCVWQAEPAGHAYELQ